MTDAQVLHARNLETAGAGALLGAAAGDVLAAGQDRTYGFLTQLNMLTAYHLLRRGSIIPDLLATEFAGLAFPDSGLDVYRAGTPWFRSWLDEARRSSPAPLPFVNAGVAARLVAVGVWFRRDSEALVDEAVRGAMVTHSQAGTLVAACALAGAVAGASFGQSGRDLVYGAAEVAKAAEARVPAVAGTTPSPSGSPPLSLLLRHAAQMVGTPIRSSVEEIRSWTPDSAAVTGVIAAILLGAPILERPSIGVRDAVALGSEPREIAVMVGGIVGARVGPHRWPWHIDNDLWFAELGRRLAGNDGRWEDLPDPYAVEEVLTFTGSAAADNQSGVASDS